MRLKTRSDFKKVFDRGIFTRGRIFKIGILENSLYYSRFGVCVPRDTTRKSPVRNRIKRLVREVIRLHRAHIKTGLDIVIIVRLGNEKKCMHPQPLKKQALRYGNLKDEIIKLLTSMGLFKIK
ncbi:MAG: ribonuclease P protein component [Candidatus Omnitrophota bacterium]